MATIFDKGVSGDKCLILNPRESLFYDFDLGTGWNELRIGINPSFTNATGDNSLASNETLGTVNPSDSFYFGFTYSPNNTLPFSNTGNVFIGNFKTTGVANTVALNGTEVRTSDGFGMGMISSGVQKYGFNTSVFPMLITPSYIQSTGSTNFIAVNYCRLIIKNKTFEMYWGRDSTTNNNVSLSYLRSKINSNNGINNMITQGPFTGFYTEDGTISSPILPYPNKVLIYSPFFNNRIRIHNLLIEKII
jgi:hypothetical protein